MPRKPEEVVNSQLRCPKSLWKQVKEIADSNRLSAAQVCIYAIEEYVQSRRTAKKP
jgi:hypothetical protein